MLKLTGKKKIYAPNFDYLDQCGTWKSNEKVMKK